jgi:diguanylate cyclase (GGDEF)-like protein/PAS domain S-box-containing protein
MSRESTGKGSGAVPPGASVENAKAPAAGGWEALLAGYPGAALVVGRDSTVIESNEKGKGLAALLKHHASPEIGRLVRQASDSRSLAAGTAAIASGKGEIVLEITVVPMGPNGSNVVLARDLTMERNLRTALVESRQRYKDLVEVNSDFAWEVGRDGRFAFVSPKGALGFKAEELVGCQARDFVVDPEEQTPLPFASEKPVENVEMWMRRADGTTGCVVTSSVPLYDESKQWRGARGVCRDVTEERESEAALARARHREQLLNYVVSTIRDELEPQNMLAAAAAATARALGAAGCRIYRKSPDGLFMVAAEHGNAEGINPIYEDIVKLTGDGAVTAAAVRGWHAVAAATQYRQSVNGAIAMWRAEEQGPWDDDHRLLIADVANQLGIANEQVINHERILKLSRTDGLTGLLNRRAFFEEELPRRVDRLERNRQSAALFYVDMDNFKRVNDVHGHQKGDEAILFLRDMLMTHSRPGDVMARLGGDEFAMWLDNIQPQVALKRAATLIRSSKEMRQFSGDEAHPLGISIGVALFDPRHGERLPDLLARADEAMYAVKRDKKGGCAVAPPPGSKEKPQILAPNGTEKAG